MAHRFVEHWQYLFWRVALAMVLGAIALMWPVMTTNMFLVVLFAIAAVDIVILLGRYAWHHRHDRRVA